MNDYQRIICHLDLAIEQAKTILEEAQKRMDHMVCAKYPGEGDSEEGRLQCWTKFLWDTEEK